MSSLGGNTASSSSIGGSGGNTASSSSTQGSSSNTASSSSTQGSTSNTAPSSRSQSSTSNTAPSGQRQAFNSSREISSLQGLMDRQGNPMQLYDQEGLFENINTSYATMIEQKMYAELMRTMIGREDKYFKDWASTRNISLNTPRDIQDFVETMQNGNFTTNDTLNGKIEKVIGYIPDIIGSLLKKDGIAPGVKIISGQNPVIDEIKFGIEKVVSPVLKKVGTLLETRFGSELGKKLGKSMITWGEKLGTLPTRVLEKVGLPDIVASIVDVALLAVDQGTGNFRQQNHDLPDFVMGIPVISQGISILSSVRDLIDTAGGIPRDDEAVPELYRNLQENLWRPAMAEYGNVMNMLGGLEPELKSLAGKAEDQSMVDYAWNDLVPRIGELSMQFGNNREMLLSHINKEYGIKYTQGIAPLSEIQSTIASETAEIKTLDTEITRARKEIEGLVEEGYQSRFESFRRSALAQNEARRDVLRNNLITNGKLEAKAKENANMETVENSIKDIVDGELGRLSPEELLTKLRNQDITDEVPQVNAIINGLEVKARVALDNVYSTQDTVLRLEGELDGIDRKIAKAKNDILKVEVKLIQVSNRISSRRTPNAEEQRELVRARTERDSLIEEKADLRDNLIPKMKGELEGLFGEMSATIREADEAGLDMSFIEQSSHWDQAIEDMEDDRVFWQDTLGQFLPGSGIGF